jgi:hypothetical protein
MGLPRKLRTRHNMRAIKTGLTQLREENGGTLLGAPPV